MTLGLIGERIPVNGQTGWDGKNYAELTIHFKQKWNDKSIDSYLFQRILPSAIGHFILKNMQLLNDGYKPVVHYFLWANVLLILLCLWLYFKIVQILKWNTVKLWMGFAALFFNFAILKQAWYYPVLTDVFAFACGMSLLYFYLKNHYYGMFSTIVIGSFIFPLFLLSSMLLFLKLKVDMGKIFRSVGWLLICYWIFLFINYLIDNSFIHEKYQMHVNIRLVYVSAFCTMIYLFGCITFFSKEFKHISNEPQGQSWFWFSFAVIYFIVHFWVIKELSIPEEVFTPRTFLLNIFQQSFSNPLAFLVFHATYFGPLVLLIPVMKKSAIGKWSFGFLLYVSCYMLLFIGTESRQFINAWPFIVIWFLHSVDDSSTSNSFAWVFVIMSIILSKCYLPINRPDIFITYVYDRFPDQMYFMNHGPFATDMSYAINLMICVISGVILFATYQKTKPINTIHI